MCVYLFTFIVLNCFKRTAHHAASTEEETSVDGEETVLRSTTGVL